MRGKALCQGLQHTTDHLDAAAHVQRQSGRGFWVPRAHQVPRCATQRIAVHHQRHLRGGLCERCCQVGATAALPSCALQVRCPRRMAVQRHAASSRKGLGCLEVWAVLRAPQCLLRSRLRAHSRRTVSAAVIGNSFAILPPEAAWTSFQASSQARQECGCSRIRTTQTPPSRMPLSSWTGRCMIRSGDRMELLAHVQGRQCIWHGRPG